MSKSTQTILVSSLPVSQYPTSIPQPPQAVHGYQQHVPPWPQYTASSTQPSLPRRASPQQPINARPSATPTVASVDPNYRYYDQHSQPISLQQQPSSTNTRYSHAQPAQSAYYPAQTTAWASRPQTRSGSGDAHQANTRTVSGARPSIPQIPSEDMYRTTTNHASSTGPKTSQPQTQAEDVRRTSMGHEHPLAPKLSVANARVNVETARQLRNITYELHVVLYDVSELQLYRLVRNWTPVFSA
jgi:hypothetical protein